MGNSVLIFDTRRGVVKTPLTQALGQMEELESFMKPRIALRRLAEPEDVTKVILFLLSDEAAYITASVSLVGSPYLHHLLGSLAMVRVTDLGAIGCKHRWRLQLRANAETFNVFLPYCVGIVVQPWSKINANVYFDLLSLIFMSLSQPLVQCRLVSTISANLLQPDLALQR